jgi:hypothetical protein
MNFLSVSVVSPLGFPARVIARLILKSTIVVALASEIATTLKQSRRLMRRLFVWNWCIPCTGFCHFHP